MRRNICTKIGKKMAEFFRTTIGKAVFGILLCIVGFFVTVKIQEATGSAIKQILAELFTESQKIPFDKITKVIDVFFSPISLNSFIFSLLWFFLGIVLTDLFCSSGLQKSSSEELEDGYWNNGDIIVGLLNHLTEQVYNRCSNSSEHCGECNKFAMEGDGLLRRYLYEESQHLQQAIVKSKEGQYSLDSNIPQYHTFAITHMMNTLGSQYSVVQWIGSKPYTDQNKYDETYDALDFDFLYTLLKKVTEVSGSADKEPYYLRDLKGEQKFKIKWLLIGAEKCMKNNFDYIFYVIKELAKDNQCSLEKQERIISEFFEFYIIDEERYKRVTEEILREYRSDDFKRLFRLENQPSFGIFGDQFMFADSLDRTRHGFIYTRNYIPDGLAQSLLDETIKIFAMILKKSSPQEFSVLLKAYETIVADDSEWEEQLKSIWNQNKLERGEH